MTRLRALWTLLLVAVVTSFAVASPSWASVTFTQTPPGVMTESNDASFAFTTTINNWTWACTLSGPTSAGTSNCYSGPRAGSASYADLADGSYAFRAEAKDFQGTTHDEGTHAFVVDLYPETTLAASPSGISSDVSPAFSFSSGHPDASFECSLDGGDYGPCDSPKRYTLLPEGEHTFGVRATRTVDGAAHVDQTPETRTWTVDSLDPEVILTQGPGVTNDRSPTWAWTAEDPNLDPDSVRCELYDDTNTRYILNSIPCSSPYTLEADLPDGDYSFSVDAEDTANNYGHAYRRFEVDSVAPKVVSGKPTGTAVSRYTTIRVAFDDDVHEAAKSVKVYKKGSSTPLRTYLSGGQSSTYVSLGVNLKSGTRYTVKVDTRVTDGANNLESPVTWNFKTRG